MLGDIINGKYAKLLLALQTEGINRIKLSHDLDINLSALSIQISRFSINGLVSKSKKGREAIVELTEYGQKQADLLSQILENINNHKNDQKSVAVEENAEKEVNDGTK